MPFGHVTFKNSLTGNTFYMPEDNNRNMCIVVSGHRLNPLGFYYVRNTLNTNVQEVAIWHDSLLKSKHND